MNIKSVFVVFLSALVAFKKKISGYFVCLLKEFLSQMSDCDIQ